MWEECCWKDYKLITKYLKFCDKMAEFCFVTVKYKYKLSNLLLERRNKFVNIFVLPGNECRNVS